MYRLAVLKLTVPGDPFPLLKLLRDPKELLFINNEEMNGIFASLLNVWIIRR